MVGISVRIVTRVGLPQQGLTEPKGRILLSSLPQFNRIPARAPWMAKMRCFSWRGGK